MSLTCGVKSFDTLFHLTLLEDDFTLGWIPEEMVLTHVEKIMDENKLLKASLIASLITSFVANWF